MKNPFLSATFASSLVLLAGCTVPMDECDQGAADNDTCLNTESEENVDQTQQGLTVKSRTFYVSNPKSAANKYTGKGKALRVTATIPSGSTLVDINFNKSVWAINYVPCSGTYCSGTRTLYGCRNYGTIPVTVEYTGAGTPSLKYWFTDCY